MSDDLALLTVVEAGQILRISRNLIYAMIARGELPAVRLGRLIRIPRAALAEWLRNSARPLSPAK